MRLTPTVAALAAMLLFAGGTTAEPTRDWPQFRGPHRDGRSDEVGLLQEWPEDGPPLAWRVDGLGKGFSSLSIAGRHIYTMTDRGKEQFVVALDRQTRKETWAARVGPEWEDGGPRSTPTADGDLLYALGPHGDLVCLKSDSGEEVWRKSLSKDFGGKMMSGWGYSESPLVEGEKLICTPGGPEAMIVALNKKTGEVLWKTKAPNLGPKGKDGAAYCSAIATTTAGVRQYIQLIGRGIIGVAADDGRLLWGYNPIANRTAVIPSPIVQDDLVFCTTSYETGSALLRLTVLADQRVEAQEVYFIGHREFENHHGGIVLVDGYVYGGHARNNGSPTCVELKTGKVMWKDRGPGGGSAAVIYADGRLYFRYQDGTMALIEASPKEYRLRGSFKLPTGGSPSWPHPVLLDGHLYLRHADSLLCYDVRAGQESRPVPAGQR